MGRVILNGPPPADDEAGHCVICLMRAKQRQWQLNEDKIKDGYAASGEKLTVIPWPDGLTNELRAGWYRGVPGDAPQLGIVDGLCWDDVAGMQPAHVSRLVNGAGAPAGLIKGRG
ncbi:MAG TPA: hypothetical protein VK284_09470 [Streptosporangiaceae bacterium]|nr:hypothetical protein [Streptosporangiaceae bacterium]